MNKLSRQIGKYYIDKKRPARSNLRVSSYRARSIKNWLLYFKLVSRQSDHSCGYTDTANGCEASICTHLEDRNSVRSGTQCIQKSAIDAEGHVHRTAACAGDTSRGIEKRQGSVLTELVTGNRSAACVGGICKLPIFGDRDPASSHLCSCDRWADHTESTSINLIGGN